MVAFPWLVCATADDMVGYAYASRHRERAAYGWSTDVAIYVDRRLQRSGVGRGLYTSLLALLRLQGFYNAYAGITLPNEASVGLHEAMGFEPVGIYKNVGYKLGRWHSVAWFALQLQPLPAVPADVRALSELLDSPTWSVALTAGEHLIRL